MTCCHVFHLCAECCEDVVLPTWSELWYFFPSVHMSFSLSMISVRVFTHIAIKNMSHMLRTQDGYRGHLPCVYDGLIQASRCIQRSHTYWTVTIVKYSHGTFFRCCCCLSLSLFLHSYDDFSVSIISATVCVQIRFVFSRLTYLNAMHATQDSQRRIDTRTYIYIYV